MGFELNISKSGKHGRSCRKHTKNYNTQIFFHPPFYSSWLFQLKINLVIIALYVAGSKKLR